jgi:dihydroorotase
LENYLQVFEEENALHQFEAFASLNGPAFYGLAINQQKLSLQKTSQQIPTTIGQQALTISPYKAGETLAWSLCKGSFNAS